jgi:ELWxxDGT repeat protein
MVPSIHLAMVHRRCRGRRGALFAALLTLIFGLSVSASAPAGLVKDIYPGVGDSNPKYFSAVDGTLYFIATDEYSAQWWHSDGTAEGTRKLDFGAGTTRPAPPVKIGQRSYFSAEHSDYGNELWSSDGTPTGTMLVKDIRPGPISSDLNGLTNLNGVGVFFADDGVHGAELWKTDGTAAGTTLLKNINGTSAGTDRGFYTTLINNTLYFYADDGQHGFELWKTDGTGAGTQLVKDVNPGSAWSVDGLPPRIPTSNGIMYFRANDGVHGFELWRSDGTTQGTTLLKDLVPGLQSSNIGTIMPAGSTIFFMNYPASGPAELWKSNGTAAGTTLITMLGHKDNLGEFEVVGSRLFFTRNDGVHGWELWISDGTAAGTSMVKDIFAGPSGSEPAELAVFAGKLIFRAGGGVELGSYEVWQSNGTAAGTTLLADVDPGYYSSFPLEFTPMGRTLFFRAKTQPTGIELWSIPRSALLPNQTFLPAVSP